MTLRWDRTAADCRVVQLLGPSVFHHFTYGPDFRWHPTTSGFSRPGESTPRALTRLLFDLGDMLPEDEFWFRTFRRLSSLHGAYAVRRTLEDYSQALREGRNCLCPNDCRYPQDPDSH